MHIIELEEIILIEHSRFILNVFLEQKTTFLERKRSSERIDLCNQEKI